MGLQNIELQIYVLNIVSIIKAGEMVYEAGRNVSKRVIFSISEEAGLLQS